jgi:hypothetical protein
MAKERVIPGLFTEDTDVEHGVGKCFFYNADELNNILGHAKMQGEDKPRHATEPFSLQQAKSRENCKKCCVFSIILQYIHIMPFVPEEIPNLLTQFGKTEEFLDDHEVLNAIWHKLPYTFSTGQNHSGKCAESLLRGILVHTSKRLQNMGLQTATLENHWDLDYINQRAGNFWCHSYSFECNGKQAQIFFGRQWNKSENCIGEYEEVLLCPRDDGHMFLIDITNSNRVAAKLRQAHRVVTAVEQLYRSKLHVVIVRFAREGMDDQNTMLDCGDDVQAHAVFLPDRIGLEVLQNQDAVGRGQKAFRKYFRRCVRSRLSS